MQLENLLSRSKNGRLPVVDACLPGVSQLELCKLVGLGWHVLSRFRLGAGALLVATLLAASTVLLPLPVVYADEITPESVKFIFPPLPMADAERQPAALVALGKKLYMDTRFSKNKKMSCNTCHNLSTFGVDNEPTSPGHEGKRGNRNSPTVFNASLHIAQFWDGRAVDVETQALGPVLNPVEMGMPAAAEIEKIMSADKEYAAMFKAAFPNEPRTNHLC